MSVADLTGVDAMRSISASSEGSRSTSASPPNATMPGDVLVRLGGERLAHVRERVLAALRPDRVGQVDDEHDREPVDREHELEPGEREHERGQQPDPDRERRAPPARAEAPARREVEHDDERDERREQESSASGASNVMPISAPAGRRRVRPAAAARRCARRSRASVSRS